MCQVLTVAESDVIYPSRRTRSERMSNVQVLTNLESWNVEPWSEFSHVNRLGSRGVLKLKMDEAEMKWWIYILY